MAQSPSRAHGIGGSHGMKRGFLLGKFMPPHAGHIHLCHAAAALCDHLTVLVCSLPDDPVSGDQRHRWMTSLCPGATVLHHGAIVPQEPKDHPDFWPIWRDICRAAHPDPIDTVFGSEPYVLRLAAELGAQAIQIDPERIGFPVSASAIRSDPAANWRFIPEPVRPLYQQRVTLVGAESTGKSTLARLLARHFDTLHMPEYGRIYAASKTGDWTAADFDTIIHRHRTLRRTLAPKAGPVLIEDTDPLLTRIWQSWLTGTPFAQPDMPDLPDLYLLMDTDLPWVDDGTRYQKDDAGRQAFQTLCHTAFHASGAPTVIIHGPPEHRFDTARAAVESLLQKARPAN